MSGRKKTACDECSKNKRRCQCSVEQPPTPRTTRPLRNASPASSGVDYFFANNQHKLRDNIKKWRRRIICLNQKKRSKKKVRAQRKEQSKVMARRSIDTCDISDTISPTDFVKLLHKIISTNSSVSGNGNNATIEKLMKTIKSINSKTSIDDLNTWNRQQIGVTAVHMIRYCLEAFQLNITDDRIELSNLCDRKQRSIFHTKGKHDEVQACIIVRMKNMGKGLL